MLLSCGEVSNPLALWEAFKEPVAEECLRTVCQHAGSTGSGVSAREFDLCLRAMHGDLQAMCGQSLAQVRLPEPTETIAGCGNFFITKKRALPEFVGCSNRCKGADPHRRLACSIQRYSGPGRKRHCLHGFLGCTWRDWQNICDQYGACPKHIYCEYCIG